MHLYVINLERKLYKFDCCSEHCYIASNFTHTYIYKQLAISEEIICKLEWIVLWVRENKIIKINYENNTRNWNKKELLSCNKVVSETSNTGLFKRDADLERTYCGYWTMILYQTAKLFPVNYKRTWQKLFLSSF